MIGFAVLRNIKLAITHTCYGGASLPSDCVSLGKERHSLTQETAIDTELRTAPLNSSFHMLENFHYFIGKHYNTTIPTPEPNLRRGTLDPTLSSVPAILPPFPHFRMCR